MNNAISVEGLNALLWTLTAVAIVLSVGRFIIRYATAGRFHLDDASHLLSLLLLIGLAAAYTSGFPYSVRIARINRKEEVPPPPTDPFYRKYLQLRLVVTLLVFMVLWSVKATFLIFYRLLFDVSRTFIRMWWAAVALVFATFWVCIGSTLTLCGSASDLFDFKKCSSPKKLHDIRATYKYWCALNVGTDLIVLILPLFMIYGLQLRTSQKIVLTAIFSLGLLVALVDILRTVESLQSGTFSGVALWSSLEVTIAVIVASLPLYRVLITRKGRRSLLSRLSMERYKNMDDHSPGATEREKLASVSDTVGTEMGKEERRLGTFRNDLETQDSAFSQDARRTDHVPLAHLPR
ncbi:MAG: hypothetical protein Q9226_006446 [Calogaya cf. arnoldii]